MQARQPASALTPVSPARIQRKCACATAVASGGECQECARRKSIAKAVREIPWARLAGAGHDFGKIEVHPGISPRRLQRKASGEMPAAQEPVATANVSAGGLIAEDDAAALSPGQMRKSDFLAELQTAVCASADSALAAAGRTAKGCPYIERWLSFYRQQAAGHIERAVRKYAPEAALATAAREYIPLVSERVSRAATTWALTGEITGVPEELAKEMGGGVLGAIGAVFSGIAGAVAGAIGGVGKALSGIGGLFSKTRQGGPGQLSDAATVHTRLGSGTALETGVRTRMESAFGHDFGRVRVHTGVHAAELSNELNARAFTIGHQVAFAPGEYRPGSPVGDALIAHELAHVVQQSGSPGQPAALSEPAPPTDALEQEADLSAVKAVSMLWGPAMLGRDAAVHEPVARLKSGLKLQRCGPSPTPQNPYEELVVEGSRKLIKPRIGFGVPWGEIGEFCGTDEANGLFDDKYWKSEKIGEESCMLVNKTSADQAIAALFNKDRSDKWQIDCGMFTQLPHYYALLKTLGPDEFNKRFNNRIELKKEFSTGLKTRAYWVEGSKPHWLVEAVIRQDTGQGPETESVEGSRRLSPKIKPNAPEKPEDEVLKAAPVGSRVNFSAFPASSPFTQEPTIDNTIKLGTDLYAAHDVPHGESGMYTKEKLYDLLAEKYQRPRDNVRVTLVDILKLP